MYVVYSDVLIKGLEEGTNSELTTSEDDTELFRRANSKQLQENLTLLSIWEIQRQEKASAGKGKVTKQRGSNKMTVA